VPISEFYQTDKSGNSDVSDCLAVYARNTWPPRRTVGLIDQVIEHMTAEPLVLSGKIGQHHFHGKTSRVLPRVHKIAKELGSEALDHHCHIWAGDTYQEEDVLFPSPVCVLVTNSQRSGRAAIIAVRKSAGKIDEFKNLRPLFLNKFDPVYGHEHTIFSKFGPSCFLNGDASIPKGESWTANPERRALLQRWQTRLRSTELFQKVEVRGLFPKNYIQGNWLNESAELAQIVQQYGAVEPSGDPKFVLWCLDLGEAMLAEQELLRHHLIVDNRI
jgi:hypothetical protein